MSLNTNNSHFAVAWSLFTTLGVLLFIIGITPLSAAEQFQGRSATIETGKIRSFVRPPAESEQPEESAPTGGSGVYVLDNVDFHPIGGGEINGLGWNNKVPVTSYYQYNNNSYLIITGSVHGAGLISGPGQDGWTFQVKLNTSEITGQRPIQCNFAAHNRAQTDKAATAWKYQLMIVFKDTKSKPECFDYFKSLANKAVPVKLIDIVGPYWTGNKTYQEPKNRYYKSGPMLSTGENHAAGHTAVPW